MMILKAKSDHHRMLVGKVFGGARKSMTTKTFFGTSGETFQTVGRRRGQGLG